MKLRPIKLNRAIRDGLIAGTVVFVVGAAVGAGVYVSAADGLKREVQSNLLSIARSASSLTDIKLHEAISKPSDYGSPTYEAVRSPYFKLLKSNPDLAFIYTNIEKAGEVYFIMDAELPKPGSASQPSGVMEKYSDASAFLRKALLEHTAQVEDKTYTDEYGTFLSAYVPLMDNDQFVGTIGVDMRVDAYLAHLNAIQISLAIGLFMALVAAALVGFITWKITAAAMRAEEASQRQASEINEMQLAQIEAERYKAGAEAMRRQTVADRAAAFQTAIQNILDEVVSTADGIGGKAGEVASVASQTQQHADSVALTSAVAADRSKQLADSAQALSGAIDEISQQSALSQKVADQAAQKADEASKNLTSLTEKSAQVSGILDVISGIASQINLLALNATIESAHAGEAGKGFAVVATEVKNLSTSVSAASQEITRQIVEMQAATEVSVKSVSEIKTIISQVQGTSQYVAAAVEKQSAVTAEIKQSVIVTAQGAQTITQDITRVQTAANDAEQSAHYVMDAAGDMTEKSARLGRCVTEFVATIGDI